MGTRRWQGPPFPNPQQLKEALIQGQALETHVLFQKRHEGIQGERVTRNQAPEAVHYNQVLIVCHCAMQEGFLKPQV